LDENVHPDQLKPSGNLVDGEDEEDAIVNKELWRETRKMSGHILDVLDLAWYARIILLQQKPHHFFFFLLSSVSPLME
jgi:hypothetical protein